MLSPLRSFVYLPSSNVKPPREEATTRSCNRALGGAGAYRSSRKQNTIYLVTRCSFAINFALCNVRLFYCIFISQVHKQLKIQILSFSISVDLLRERGIYQL